MSNNVSLTDAISFVRERGEFREQYISNTIVTAWLNESMRAWYDMVINIHPDMYHTTGNISVVAGTDNYSLPADFYHPVGVDVTDFAYSSGYRTMSRYNFADRNNYSSTTDKDGARYHFKGNRIYISPSPGWSDTVRIHYIPTAPQWTTGASTVNDWDGWLEWVICDVLIKCAAKEESDASIWVASKKQAEERIRKAAEWDKSEPESRVNIYDANYGQYPERWQ
jgi:hypothetical protein